MVYGATGYIHLKSVIGINEVNKLKDLYKEYIRERKIPCYALLDQQELPAFEKIRAIVEEVIGSKIYYLNDFYLYTNVESKAGWHMDTELFTFQSAINAWIPLCPNRMDSPLALLQNYNHGANKVFHNLRRHGDVCSLENYKNGEVESLTIECLENSKVQSPDMNVGDILLFNPALFHKTNTTMEKHCAIIKFLFNDPGSEFLSASPVDSWFWPEVEVFTKYYKASRSWKDFLGHIKIALNNANEREVLTSGFYPDRFALYEKMVKAL